MKKLWIIMWIIIFLFATSVVRAQDTIVMSAEQCEAQFLKENLILLAEHLRISQAEAMVQQARLWPNPSFTFDQVNFWATPHQTNNEETSPPLWRNFGRDQQFAVEIEQMIITAGKRKKMIAIEELGVEKASAYFAELLHNLKLEFRNLMAELLYFQQIEQTYTQQIASVSMLATAYKNQLERGNVAKGEYVRLKALELELLGELNELKTEKNATQKELKTLMRLPTTSTLFISEYQQIANNVSDLNLQDLITRATENRQDLKIATIDKQLSDKLYAYQRAQRIPDMSLKALYDRNGSTMLDFVGFGIAFDLPIFDRNQGNINAAKTDIEIAHLTAQQIQQTVENQVVEAYHNLLIALDFQKNIEPDYEKTLDDLFVSYTLNFQQRNIDLIEFIDFMEAYTANKRTIYQSNKNVSHKIEELKYAVGTELN